MVILVLAVPDFLTLAQFDEVFYTMLGWDGLRYSVHIHAIETPNIDAPSGEQGGTLRDFT